MQRATGADKVAQIPGLDRRKRFLIESLTIQIELYGLGAVLYQEKSTPIANQPARYRKLPVALFQLRLITVAKLTLQFRRFCSAAKSFGNGFPEPLSSVSFARRSAMSLFSSVADADLLSPLTGCSGLLILLLTIRS